MAEGGDQTAFIIADLSRFTEREVVALSLNVDANLRDNPPIGTPIDTGWASANWVPSVGEPSTIRANDRDPTPAMIAARRSAGEAGLNEVLAWEIDDGPIFISNSVPYIRRLNDGHSPQSPPGFVQAAMALAVEQTEAGASRRSGSAGTEFDA
jgi:hypothetical protein